MPDEKQPERRGQEVVEEGKGGHPRRGPFNPQEGPAYTPQERTEEAEDTRETGSFNPEEGPAYTPQERTETDIEEDEW